MPPDAQSSELNTDRPPQLESYRVGIALAVLVLGNARRVFSNQCSDGQRMQCLWGIAARSRQ